MPFLWTLWSHHTMCKKVVIYHRPHDPHILMIMCAICHKSMTFCVYTILGFHSSRALKLQILFRSPSVERIGKHIYQETISVPVDLDVQYLEKRVRWQFCKMAKGGQRWQFCKMGGHWNIPWVDGGPGKWEEFPPEFRQIGGSISQPSNFAKWVGIQEFPPHLMKLEHSPHSI